MSRRVSQHRFFASIHLPKCGGSSTKLALVALLGPDLVLDYGDRINDYTLEGTQARECSRKALRRSVLTRSFAPFMVHGHFYAAKYLGLPIEPVWLAVFREPCALLHSYYRFLRRDHPWKAGLLDRVQAMESFEEFVEDRDFQNIMSRLIYPLSVDDFEYVGILDLYTQYIRGLERLLQRGSLSVEHENAESDGQQALDAGMCRRIAELNSADMELFESVKERVFRYDAKLAS